MRFASVVEWELTRGCDLRCQHCMARPNRARTGELDTDEALATSVELVRLGTRVVVLSGGEPLLRGDWTEIASALTANGVEVQVISNGQRINERAATRLREAGVGLVQLSLDGLEATHDTVRRRPGAYRAVIRAARALRREGVPFGFATTVLRPNLGEMGTLAELVQGLGAVGWKMSLGMPHHASDLWLRPAQVAALPHRLTELTRHVPLLSLGDNLSPRTRCEGGRSFLGLRSDGAVTGCLALPEACHVGSLRDQSLLELWHQTIRDRERRMAALGAGCHATALCGAGRSHRSPGAPRMRLRAVAAAALVGACGGSSTTGGAPPPAPPAVSVPRPTAPTPTPPSEPDTTASEPEPSESDLPARHPDARHESDAGAPEPPDDWGMPSCCTAHVLRPDCPCGGPPSIKP